MSNRDKLAECLAETLNKKSDGTPIAYFLDGLVETPTDISGWVSTGSSMLDLAISNRKNGGIPVGRIVEINGLESSGKSLLAAHMLAEVQKLGGVAVYIDTETAISPEFLQSIGIDINNMIYAHLDTVEDIFETIESIIETVRKKESERFVCVVVDSVMGASTKVEMDADYDKDGYATTKAILMSKALRKITSTIGRQRISLVFTNQLRQKMGVMFGDPYTTSGGKALAFHSSVRLRLKNLGQIKHKRGGIDEVIGIRTSCKVIKNRVGPPFRTADFDIYFDRGIDDSLTWLDNLTATGIVSKSGSWYTLKEDENGIIDKDARIKFQGKDFVGLFKNGKFKDFVYDKICEYRIMKYRNQDLELINPDEIEDSDESLSGDN